MTVSELAALTGFRVLAMPNGTQEITDVYIGDLLSWVMGRAKEGDAWITIMSNKNIVAVATLSECASVILAEGVEPDEGVAELAEQKGINLLSTEMSAYRAALEISRHL